jgi:hypothetical protein
LKWQKRDDLINYRQNKVCQRSSVGRASVS